MVTANAELNAALAKKAEAEAREIEARIVAAEEMRAIRLDRARAGRDAALAIARKELAQAAAAEDIAREQGVQAEIILRKHREEMAAPQHHHIFTFSSNVAEAPVAACQLALNQWHQLDPGCPIQIDITSYGGDVVQGMRLFDYIREVAAAGHRITTVNRGCAGSMAGILLQSGDVRVMGPQAWLLVHEVSFMALGKIGEVEDTTKWAEKICEHILDIFVKRSNGKLDRTYMKEHWTRKDWWLDAGDALGLGMIDEIGADGITDGGPADEK